MKITESDLEEVAYEVGGEPMTDYSGRGMYGKECVAITGDVNAVQVGVALATVLGEDDAERIARNAKRDSMGLDIVIYFPGVTIGEW